MEPAACWICKSVASSRRDARAGFRGGGVTSIQPSPHPVTVGPVDVGGLDQSGGSQGKTQCSNACFCGCQPAIAPHALCLDTCDQRVVSQRQTLPIPNHHGLHPEDAQNSVRAEAFCGPSLDFSGMQFVDPRAQILVPRIPVHTRCVSCLSSCRELEFAVVIEKCSIIPVEPNVRCRRDTAGRVDGVNTADGGQPRLLGLFRIGSLNGRLSAGFGGSVESQDAAHRRHRHAVVLCHSCKRSSRHQVFDNRAFNHPRGLVASRRYLDAEFAPMGDHCRRIDTEKSSSGTTRQGRIHQLRAIKFASPLLRARCRRRLNGHRVRLSFQHITPCCDRPE